ncbi:DUF6364 family protein [Marinoscillum furvescens]|nr:DUF6364 family protein [Marinoscillum furvescens]
MKKKMLNVRLDDTTEQKLKQYAQDHDMSKSDVVHDALEQYLTKKETEQRPFALGQDLFGVAGSEATDLSKTYKSRLKKLLNEKHAH